MGIPDHLTCLLRNLYGGQEATVRIGHGTTDWFQVGKGVHQGLLLCTESYLLLDTVSTLFFLDIIVIVYVPQRLIRQVDQSLFLSLITF